MNYELINLNLYNYLFIDIQTKLGTVFVQATWQISSHVRTAIDIKHDTTQVLRSAMITCLILRQYTYMQSNRVLLQFN